MKLSDLKDNPRNPRRVSEDKLDQLKKSLIEFGSLDGFIFNAQTGHLISGHQRKSIFQEGEIWITKEENGEAYGYLEFAGNRFPYREVNWPKKKERLAMIAANNNAGQWDYETLREEIHEADAQNDDLELTMFSQKELEDLMEIPEPKTRKPVKCPNCGFLVNGEEKDAT